MPQPIDCAYVEGQKYLFKTGFDSYVSGTLKRIFEDELCIKDARLQIPPTKIEKFMETAAEFREQPVHSEMIINRSNVDWAVPTK